jgi:hypothetical protein
MIDASSVAERTIIAVDHLMNMAMNHAWASMCRDAARRGPLRLVQAEDHYAGGDICSLERPADIEDDQPLV